MTDRTGVVTRPTVEIVGGRRVALLAGSGVFLAGVLAPLSMMLWATMAMAVIALAGTALVHTGGLDPATFKTSLVVALVIAVPLLLVTWAQHVVRAHEGHLGEGWGSRHPVVLRGGWLIGIAAVTTLAAAQHSPYFPYPAATMAVLAAVIYLTVASFVATIRGVSALARTLYQLGAAGAYAAGFLTAAMLLLGAAGAWAHREGMTLAPWRLVAAEAELGKVSAPHGPFDAGMQVLCLGAGEVAPSLARSRAAAPGCQFLPGVSGGDTAEDDCFARLMPQVPKAKGVLRREFGLNAYDAEDAAMAALLATCTAKDVGTPEPYFFKAARNHARRDAMKQRRELSCADLDEPAVAASLHCAAPATPELTARTRAQLWDKVLCQLDEPAARILRSRLVDDLSFREAGQRWGMTEARARDTFHNAVKKVRRLGLADCYR